MSAVEKRSVSLAPELAEALDRAVANGEFGNASEAVREALRQWEDQRSFLNLRSTGIDAADRTEQFATSAAEQRSMSLTPELAAVVDRVVANGEFSNASEVVREALLQWKQRRELDLRGYTAEELHLLWGQDIASGEERSVTESSADLVKRGGQRLD